MARKAGAVVGLLFLAHTAAAQFGQQGSKLVSGGLSFDFQGWSVAISGDGNTAIIGMSGVNVAYVFTRSGGVWSQQGNELVGSSGPINSSPSKGNSVAISADGNTAILGVGDYSPHVVAYVFTRSDGVWTQQGSELVTTDTSFSPITASVAISADGNTAILGGPNDNTFVGAAWVFTRSDGVWTQQGSKLVGTGGVYRDAEQGSSVAISADGNTAIIGGPGDNNHIGAAWVFTRSGGVWTQQGSKLVGTGAFQTSSPQQGFSVAISADGNTAIIGGPLDGYSDSVHATSGAAWVFTRSDGVWTQQGGKLVGTEASGGAQQGDSVAISADGNTAIVGGPWDGYSGSWDSQEAIPGSGAAWVFTRSDRVWTQLGRKLVGTGAVATTEYGAQQGWSVAISADGNTAVIGGPGDNNNKGAAWVFVAGGCTSPSITSQPLSTTIVTGHTAILSVTVTGTPPFAYQWYQGVSGDTAHPVGVNHSSFGTPTLTSATSYWVRVFNTCGTADSATATITVRLGVRRHLHWAT